MHTLLFGPLKSFLKCSNRHTSTERVNNKETSTFPTYERFFNIGATIKVKWTKEQLGVRWKVGWYTATVQSADIDNDQIDITYLSETDVLYTLDVTPSISSGKIKIL